jgi:glycosyltransferase involved in cell wall biosynthesis
MSTPRVMFVNHTSMISGAELVLLDLVQSWRGASAFLFEDGPLNGAMKRLGLQVITSRWGRGLTNVRRDNSLWTAVPLAGRLCAIAAEIGRAAWQHDVVYANSQKAFVLAAVATAMVRRPLVWHLHDIINGAHFGSAQRRLQIALANHRAARVIVPSQSAAAAFVAAGGRRGLVEVVPNGIDLIPENSSRSELRKQLGLPEGPLAGVFSRLAPWKGQHVVLQALAKLPEVRCIFAGDALFGEQAYAQSLRNLASELSLNDRVHFLGHRNDVTRLMQAVDVMIHPSVAPEPFGRTLVEAMRAGVPVIATDTGAASDILEAGAAGTLVRANDADALIAAMAHVLANPTALAAQLEYAASRARTRYGVGKMLEAVSDLIGHVATGARA